MKPTLTLFLATGLILFGCASTETETIVSTWSDGTVKEMHRFEEGVAGHEIQQFHSNGLLHVRGRMVDGAREGTWNTYREDGLPWSQVDYVAGQKEGLFRSWHASGLPHIEGQHTNGKPSGVWHFFDVTGQPDETRDFDTKEGA